MVNLFLSPMLLAVAGLLMMSVMVLNASEANSQETHSVIEALQHDDGINTPARR